MTKKQQGFIPTLMPHETKWKGGYASSGVIDPSHWASELYGASIPGPWLVCYMLRRFGWPNLGSDDYKDICAWALTTPMEGLYLVVRPHLDDGGPLGKPFCGHYIANLHFSILFTEEVGKELNRDPEFEEHWARVEASIRDWWAREGSSLYVFAEGEVDEEGLVHEWGKREGKVLGLWKRSAGEEPQAFEEKVDNMVLWWMGEFLREKHPGVMLKGRRKQKRQPTAFQQAARAAIEVVLKDLLRPVYVRDLGFSPFGDVERTCLAKERYEGQPGVEHFEGAGYTPERWYKRTQMDEG